MKTKNKIVDGKSMMGIVSLAAHQPLTVVAKGDDACDFAGQLDQILYRFNKKVSQTIRMRYFFCI